MLYEAFQSKNFHRFGAAEVDGELVQAVRRNRGCVSINVASDQGVRTEIIRGLEIWNPNDPEDVEPLTQALAHADELATALPSVAFYNQGTSSVAKLLAHMPRDKNRILYAGENHNEAAAILTENVGEQGGGGPPAFAPLNTVIGKMCGTVRGWDEIKAQGLAPLTPDLPRAVLVEAFNHILISPCPFPGHPRGIGVFEEKPDLLPFEEAKLFGHNAVHFALACLAQTRGHRTMADVRHDAFLLDFGRELFTEIGGALSRRHENLRDPLFTPAGFKTYGDDLLTRMTNPFLRDEVGRVCRDPLRKLAPGDRLAGAATTCLSQAVAPRSFGRALAAGLAHLARCPAGAPPALARALPRPGEPWGPQAIHQAMGALWGEVLPKTVFDELGPWVHLGFEWLLEKGLN